MKRKICLMLSLAMCLFTGCAKGETKLAEENLATVEFLKVGKADSAIIRTNDLSIVIDCGEKSDGKKICARLEELGIEKLDYIILTHFDQDHIGGAARVIKKIGADHVIAPANYAGDGNEYDELCDAMKLKEMEFETSTEIVNITSDDTKFRIYPCQKESYSDGNDNNHSLIVRMEHQSNVFLFAADAMEERLEEIMDIGDCDVMKAPYHGRKIKNLGEFLDKTTPEYAVISTDASTLSSKSEKEFLSRNIKTFVTFRDGNIICKSDGKKIAFETDLR